jgi:hypothetical protein
VLVVCRTQLPPELRDLVSSGKDGAVTERTVLRLSETQR